MLVHVGQGSWICGQMLELPGIKFYFWQVAHSKPRNKSRFKLTILVQKLVQLPSKISGNSNYVHQKLTFACHRWVSKPDYKATCSIQARLSVVLLMSDGLQPSLQWDMQERGYLIWNFDRWYWVNPPINVHRSCVKVAFKCSQIYPKIPIMCMRNLRIQELLQQMWAKAVKCV